MRKTYHPVSVMWHWLIAILVLAAFVIILSIDEGGGFTPEKVLLMNRHKWVGMLVLYLSVFRIAARLLYPAPPMGADVHMPGWQNALHKITLLGMIVLTVAVPLVGWLMSSAKGFPVVWFGVIHMPDLVGKNKELGETLAEVHVVLAWALAALVGLHIVASIKHRFIDKDSVLGRMVPWMR